ncbi:MAG TPA: DNA-processing protein DprA [Gemmatimonadaceae bacterium]|nr:DNA-processing protein DprA [Gemmatimonadaceae bacterium]
MPDVGPRAYRERSAAFGSPARAFNATVGPRDRTTLRDEAERVANAGERYGARLLLIDEADYPAKLRHLFDPPPFLFVVGDLTLIDRPCVAIVGTRRATPYGERATAALTAELVDSGVCIVSGMARGIDSVAHRAALARKAATIAVLGTGIDIAYPASHRALHEAIGARGLLVSEFPCGARPGKYAFPRRNRVIAALAALTIVVEAGEKSGALITADHAIDLGREIGAVPGPIDSPQSIGTNRLIRDGAHAILQGDDALGLIGLRDKGVRPFPVAPVLHGDELVVWNALANGAAPVDWIVEHTALEPKRALSAITALELSGLVETSPVGELRRMGM